MNVGINLPKIGVGAKDLRDFNETLKTEWIIASYVILSRANWVLM